MNLGFEELDATDVLAGFRTRFYIPERQGKPVLYFTGNSLGLMPQSVEAVIQEELEDWKSLGVDGHMHSRRPWFSYHRQFQTLLAPIVGALPYEVVAMNSLTVNLHLMLASFYRPTRQRYKVIIAGHEFPSDRYAVASAMQLHGINPREALVELVPTEGYPTLSTEHIENAILAEGDALALVMFSGVHYYTGQFFDIPAITRAAHAVGAFAGFDLAHAAGNVNLDLHDWGPDFAVWCSYKYLNSGPGGVGGAFVHDRHAHKTNLPRLAGWWGNDEATRFQMAHDFVPAVGADGWQLSNAPILTMAAHLASLRIFNEARMDRIGEKRDRLTAFAEQVVLEAIGERKDVEIITPSDPRQRGSQLSIRFASDGKAIFNALHERGVIADWRHPDVIRIAPVPLYNTFEDVARFGQILKELLGR